MSLSSNRISPLARLTNLVSGAALGTTPHLLAWTITWNLSQPGDLAVTISPADPGSTTSSPSFGESLLAGVGTDTGTAPVPTLLEVSLDGTNYDARKIIEHARRSPGAGKIRVVEDGSDLFVLYAGVGLDRLTYTQCLLSDVLGAAAGTIVPVALPAVGGGTQIGFIAPLGVGQLPNLAGIFPSALPGYASWTARSSILFTPCCDPAVKDLIVNVDAWADYTSRSVQTICDRLGGKFISGDTVPQGSRGQYVSDSSDAALNITSRVDTRVAATGAQTNTSGGVERSVVVGRVGTSPFLTFDGNSNDQPDETTTAPILDGATIQTSLDDLYGEVRFLGGPSDAGLPGGYKLTNIINLDAVGGSSAWDANVAVASVYVSPTVGGLYYTLGDGLFTLFSPPMGVYDVSVDTSDDQLYIATDYGVYGHPSTTINTTDPWTLIGSLASRVVKVRALGSGGLVAAHVKGAGASIDGIYLTNVAITLGVYTAIPADANDTGLAVGHDGWTRAVPGSSILDFEIADDHSIFILDGAKPGEVYLYDYVAQTYTFFALPSHVKGTHLYRVASSQNSIWCTTSGDTVGLYFLLYTSSWQPFASGNDGSLQSPDTGQALVVYRVLGPNRLTNGVTVRQLACTNNGLYWGTALGAAWLTACGQNGLAGTPITAAIIGLPQSVASRSVQRIHAINETQFFTSNSAGNWWIDLTRDKVTPGPAFTLLAKALNGGVAPGNDIVTISSAATSGTNLHLDNTLLSAEMEAALSIPTGWQWKRRLDGHNNWIYALVNPAAPIPTVKFAQMTDIQTNTTVSLYTASAELAQVMKMYLGLHSVPQTILTLPSSFTQQNAALRLLRPSDQVLVTYSGALAMLGGDGVSIVSTVHVGFTAKPFMVMSHSISHDEGAAGVALTATQVGTFLRVNDASPDDLAAAQAWDAKNQRVFGAR